MLYCCVCLYVRETANEAHTIINGQAVCEDHAEYVQGDLFSVALAQARRTETP